MKSRIYSKLLWYFNSPIDSNGNTITRKCKLKLNRDCGPLKNNEEVVYIRKGYEIDTVEVCCFGMNILITNIPTEYVEIVKT